MANEVALDIPPTTGPTADGRPPKGWWFIYFYGTEDGSEIKFGKTRQAINARRAQHENHSGHDVPMRLLAAVLGQASDEKELKRHFAHVLSRKRSGEWIYAGETIRGYLRWLRGQPYVAMSESAVTTLVPVDSSQWLPTSGRFKAPAQLRLVESDPWADLVVDHVTEGDFYSPGRLVEAARRTMGAIDLDPASCREANTVVQASRYFSYRENGLLHDWSGCLWINPPYGNWDEWTPKTLAEWHSGRVTQMCLLASSRVSTAQYFHGIVREASAVVIGCGRLAFWGPKANAPDEGHFVYYFGPHVEALAREFSLLGTAFVRGAS